MSVPMSVLISNLVGLFALLGVGVLVVRLKVVPSAAVFPACW